MKRLVKFVAVPVVLMAVLAAASPSSAQNWGFYVNGPNTSFGASSYGYGGYGYGSPGYGYAAPGYGAYRGRGFVGLNYRPSVQLYATPYCPPPSYCLPPPVYHHHHHGHHGHGHGRW